MFGLSFGEIIFLGALALIVIGPKQLPEMARNLGRFLNELKRAANSFTDDIKAQARTDFDFDPKKYLTTPEKKSEDPPPNDSGGSST